MHIAKRHLSEIIDLRHGGIASLYTAKTSDNRRVVLRELQKQFIFKPRMHKFFVHGIRIRKKLSPCDYLVNSLSLGYSGLRPYEIIEYVPGKSLKQLMNSRHESIKANSLTILKQVAKALNHMHNRDMVHLDVKPENILVINNNKAGTSLKVKLTDFDLSRRCQSGFRGRLKAGTPSHMAPEQLTKGKVTPSNDIFAFGVLAYYLVTDRMPFSGFSLQEARQKQISNKHQLKEPVRYNSDISGNLNKLIMHCLEKDTSNRIPNMGYLCQQLERI